MSEENVRPHIRERATMELVPSKPTRLSNNACFCFKRLFLKEEKGITILQDTYFEVLIPKFIEGVHIGYTSNPTCMQ